MIKTAIFVEGQTELIFVRELLLKIFEYQRIALECYTLFTDSNFNPTEYAFPNQEAEHFFQIINVGNDQSVLTRILRREKFMRNAGFVRIIGLRDMYSREYREEAQNHKIDLAINQKFIDGAREQIKSTNIYFSFAIMEVEAWLLGLRKVFAKMDEKLTPEFIEEKLGFNLDTINPEEAFFHPANQVIDLFGLIGKHYNKSKGDINAIVSHIAREDYFELLESTKCDSFKEFMSFLNLPTNN
ncbi:MAG TPA: DUF4276 family protein [Puia sp.]|nr:DUF4276 family protein [Puia sp.]